LHTGFEDAAEEGGDIGSEGLGGGTEEAGAGAVSDLWSALHEVDEGWGRVIAFCEQSGEDAAHGGSSAEGFKVFCEVAALALEGIMGACGTGE
jgi:hypothetical protein